MTGREDRPNRRGDRRRLPGRLTDAELRELRGQTEDQFGAEAAGVLFGSFAAPIPDDVLVALRDTIAGMGNLPAGMEPPPIEEIVEAHDHMRRVVGDLREPDARRREDGAR